MVTPSSNTVTDLPTSPSAVTTAVAVGDMDGDGELDIVIARADFSPMQLLLDNGSGGYSTTDLSPSSGEFAVAVGDLDNDGDLDIVYGDSGVIYFMLNDGNGNFATPSMLVTSGSSVYPSAIILSDLDGDGSLDIFVGFSSGPCELYINNGDASITYDSFTVSNTAGFNDEADDISVGDVNNDGHLDLLIVTSSPTKGDLLLLNNGDGTGYTKVNLPHGLTTTSSIAVGDVDDDGDVDIVIGIKNAANKLLLNDGTGTFTSTDLPGGSLNSVSVGLGDYDGDGDLDIIVGNFNSQNKWLMNDGSGNFNENNMPNNGLEFAAQGMALVGILYTENFHIVLTETDLK